VDLAKDPVEKAKLNKRYGEMIERARAKTDVETVLQKFKTACEHSVAVINFQLLRLHREIASETEVFETFYDLDKLRLREFSSVKYNWNKLRTQAEIELLGTHIHLDKLHYACLSIGGASLSNYGDCMIELAEPMIAHRASCFEGNSALVYAIMHSFADVLKSEWTDRAKLCEAVCGDRLGQSTKESEFPGILVFNGNTSEDDRFIEVHIFGPMTANTFRYVKIDATKHATTKHDVYREAIQEKLGGIQVEVIRK